MTWSEVVISVVSVILTALASWGVSKLIELINSKISNTNAANLLTSAISTITDVVKQTYQTYVESLKESGDFGEDAQKTALANALETIKSLLSTEVQEYITEHYGDLEKWLTTQIESAIYTLKNGSTESAE